MVKNGADVVLCQHSRCIGCYEEFEGGHILYGQGNFHFCKSDYMIPEKAPFWNSALAVHYDTKANTMEFTPIVNNGSGIALAKGEEKENILSAFAKRNEELQNGEWKKGWHQFCLDNAESYLGYLGRACAPGATQRDNDVFGHYLDCEAHTDVWRELFPTYNLTNER